MLLNHHLMNEKKQIICYGELVVDCFGSVTEGFMPKFGGAPGNTAIGLTKLEQTDVSFVGMVGADFFGDFLGNTLEANGVDTTHLLRAKLQKTTLAFVSLSADGERDFSFYSGAHDAVSTSDVKDVDFTNARVLQFGSLTQSNDECFAATNTMIKNARDAGTYISYDPNVRLPLWESEEKLKYTITKTIPKVDMLKINEEELEFLTGHTDPEKGANQLWQDNLQVLLITLGAQGAYWKTADSANLVSTSKIRPVDTTGAGDAFNASILYQLFPHISAGQLDLNAVNLDEAAHFANRVASLSTLNKGAVESLPTLEEVQKIL